jgi:hypothetical protein
MCCAAPRRFLQTIINLAEKVVDEPQPDAVQLGDSYYTDRVYVGVLVFRERTTETYEEFVDRVRTAPLLLAALASTVSPPDRRREAPSANSQIG